MTQSKSIDSRLLYVFLAVPLLSSIFSAIHLVNMVNLGNPVAMAVGLAITFEIGSIVTFISLSKSILKRLKKELLLFIFVVLFLLQSFGNVYSSFDYVRHKLIADPTWLDSFREMFFNMIDATTAKFTLAVLIGLPIPVISLVMFKIAIDYFSFDEQAEQVQVKAKSEVVPAEAVEKKAPRIKMEPVAESAAGAVAETPKIENKTQETSAVEPQPAPLAAEKIEACVVSPVAADPAPGQEKKS